MTQFSVLICQIVDILFDNDKFDFVETVQNRLVYEPKLHLLRNYGNILYPRKFKKGGRFEKILPNGQCF